MKPQPLAGRAPREGEQAKVETVKSIGFRRWNFKKVEEGER